MEIVEMRISKFEDLFKEIIQNRVWRNKKVKNYEQYFKRCDGWCEKF